MNKNGELEKRMKIYMKNILIFFQRIAGVSVVNKYCSNNEQGNQVYFFWPHTHFETIGTTEIAPLPAKGDTS